MKIGSAISRFILFISALALIGAVQIAFAYGTAAPPLPSSEPQSPAVLPAPTIAIPKDGAIVSGKKTTLRWNPVKGANRYSIEMSFRQPGMTDFVTSGLPVGSTQGTSFDYDLTQLKDGTAVRWLLSGTNLEAGLGGTISKEAEFTYKKSVKKSLSSRKKMSQRSSKKSVSPGAKLNGVWTVVEIYDDPNTTSPSTFYTVAKDGFDLTFKGNTYCHSKVIDPLDETNTRPFCEDITSAADGKMNGSRLQAFGGYMRLKGDRLEYIEGAKGGLIKYVLKRKN